MKLLNLLESVTGGSEQGADIRLTLDRRLQQVAMEKLQSLGKRGAVLVLDARSGAVLAMASVPSYDPNLLEENWDSLEADPAAPLLNRATQGLYTPGSVFKLVTAAAALDSGAFEPDSRFSDETGSIEIYGNTITNLNRLPHGEHDLSEAFAQSVNTTFAQVGDELGQEKLVEYMQRFGFYERPPLELPPGEVAASGRYENGALASPGAQLDPVQVAWTAIGQEQLQVTPLMMAMVAQAVANDGEMMRPYVVDSVVDPDGIIVKQADPAPWKHPISADTAAELRRMMVKVVEEGTGEQARTSKVRIAAKTGTAEVEGRRPNAWFAGFAPADDPRIAIAVVVEDAGYGADVAAPLARDVILAALGL